MTDWGDKFQGRLDEKKNLQAEERKNFDVYRDHVLRLFDAIEKKVKSVPAIQLTKPIVGRTEEYRMDVKGPFETIKSVRLKCGSKTVEFIPDGVNTPIGKGRIRIRHQSRALGQFVYLYLIKDPTSTRPYPENLTWVLQDQKGGTEPTKCPRFDDDEIERVLEACLLED